MLGRQGFKVQGKQRWRYKRSLRRNSIEVAYSDFLQDDGYAETLLRKLGFGDVETMDFSDYEGATVLHDLNHLPPPELEGQFDMILDGGRIEHVFNVPNALECVYRMLRPGGRLISNNGLNGWHGHGMYQFNPNWSGHSGTAPATAGSSTAGPFRLIRTSRGSATSGSVTRRSPGGGCAWGARSGRAGPIFITKWKKRKRHTCLTLRCKATMRRAGKGMRPPARPGWNNPGAET